MVGDGLRGVFGFQAVGFVFLVRVGGDLGEVGHLGLEVFPFGFGDAVGLVRDIGVYAGEEPGEHAIGGDEAFADELAVLPVFLACAVDGAIVGDGHQSVAGGAECERPAFAEGLGLGAVAQVVGGPGGHPHSLGRAGDGPGGGELAEEQALLVCAPPLVAVARIDEFIIHGQALPAKVERAKDNRIGFCRTGWRRQRRRRSVRPLTRRRPGRRGVGVRPTKPSDASGLCPPLSCFCFWFFGGLVRLCRAASVCLGSV